MIRLLLANLRPLRMSRSQVWRKVRTEASR